MGPAVPTQKQRQKVQKQQQTRQSFDRFQQQPESIFSHSFTTAHAAGGTLHLHRNASGSGNNIGSTSICNDMSTSTTPIARSRVNTSSSMRQTLLPSPLASSHFLDL